ncbi:MAG: ATP-binding protein [Calditrichia bacterium]
MTVIEIKLPSDPKYLKIARGSIAYLCNFCGFSKEERDTIVLAVDEAMTNIIKHAYGNDKNKPIIIKCRILRDRLEIILRDFGKKADPRNIKSRNLQDVRPGGLGVHFIQSSMDSVVYDNSLKEGNRLTLLKYFPEKSKNHVRN